MNLGPLVFEEIYKPTPWGGRALARVAGKRLPPGVPVGESWEISDENIVRGGPWAGRTLAQVTKAFARDLVGRRVKAFPLLIKLIDARERLSVQVHPDEEAARRLGGACAAKTEAWHILNCRPGARLISGLRSARDIPRLRELAVSGELAARLASVELQPGQTWLCPARTVHALGPGMVVLEVQQRSETTYRLYDWDRMGLDGKPRVLHLDEAVSSVGTRACALRCGVSRRLKAMPFEAERHTACDFFVIDRWCVAQRARREKARQFEILYVLSGQGRLDGRDGETLALRRGMTVLIPAAMSTYDLVPTRELHLIRAAEPE